MSKRLKRFKCCVCGEIELVPGGNSIFHCSRCKHHRFGHGPQACQSILNGRDAAMGAVSKAIRLGELAHPSGSLCVDCGAPATEYDHRDYSKPLEVQPVCRRCNLNRGPAIPIPHFFSRCLGRGESPYRLNKKARKLFESIGANTDLLDEMPPLLSVDHWHSLIPYIAAAMPRLEPDFREAGHA